MKLRITLRCCPIILQVMALVALPSSQARSESSNDIQVNGSGVRPRMFFACCNGEMTLAKAMFADGSVIAQLQNLNAGVAIGTDDFSPARAEVVQRLNDAGIPVIASLVVPGDQGYYLNSGNAPEAAERFTEFQQWTERYHLRWSAIGLDIEPDIRLFESLLHNKKRLLPSLFVRYFEFSKMHRARMAYGDLIRRMQSQGYDVQTYQLPLIVAERQAHLTLLERLLGIVDIRGNEEVIMIYTSFNKALGSSIIWTLGPDAQEIAIGTTVGGEHALNWNEFSRDLLVAAHFSKTIGVFNLEGSIQRGYLSSLETMNWGQSVSIDAQTLAKAERFRRVVIIVLWLGEFSPYLFITLVLALIWAAFRIGLRIKTRRNATGTVISDRNVG